MSMSQASPPRPDVSHLITEDGAAVDSFLSEKQMRLLTTPLYAAWKPGRPFVAAANVGLFIAAKNPPLVPDVLVSLDVEAPQLTGPDRVKSYFVWELGKVPDIVIEIVSDTEGDELTDKLRSYERTHVPHYVVFDPLRRLSDAELHTFSLDGGAYTQRPRFAAEGLALTRWDGIFEGARTRWLRWTDLDGALLPTPEESEARAQAEAQRADAATAEAERERQRAEALAARLRALGVEPEG